jgi:nucleoside-diphosphate-sugar epimerase
MENEKHRVFVTGAAGYVGAMLVEELAKRDDVEKIIGLDKEPVPELIKDEPKLVYVEANTSDGMWQEKVRKEKPDIVIHTAWQIRMMYGHADTTWKWNVDGSRAVFEFALSLPVERLIHFSTASIYGAYADNTFEHRFKENEPLREHEYLYGVEKKAAEEALETLVKEKRPKTKIAVIRPAAITGPRGRYQRIRFGLQSALSGQLKGGFIYPVISFLVSFVPATKGWVRQFIHEDDIADVTLKLAFHEWKGSDYEVYNATPNGVPVYAKDMAKAVGKKILPIAPWMARVAYFFFWHATRGKIPTAPGSWRFYSYPIVMDGTKLEKQLGYRCRAESYDAFYKTAGRYEYAVPEEKRVG